MLWLRRLVPLTKGGWGITYYAKKLRKHRSFRQVAALTMKNLSKEIGVYEWSIKHTKFLRIKLY